MIGWRGRFVMPTGSRTCLYPCDLPLTPLEAARLLRDRAGFFWCDSSDETAGRLSVLTCEPVAVLRGGPGDWPRLLPALDAIRASVDPRNRRRDLGLPGPGLFGSIDFDGSWCFGAYLDVLVYDHGSEQWWIQGEFINRLAHPPPRRQTGRSPIPVFQPLWSRDGFVSAVHKALDYIADGDIYQVNLAQPWRSDWPEEADLFPYYDRLRAFSPTPHAAFFDLGGRQVASASPELFLRISGRTVQTRPIKGTRPRLRMAQEDERSAYDLITSPKEIAELIMITDLERNDLGQVCDFGSVLVTDLLRLERYQQVFHLVSTIEGTLRANIDHLTALWACLPGGSISGAPKRRALEIIRELEPFPRGLYTGVIGWIGAYEESQFNIAIRTAVAEAGSLHFHAGAGIVADSNPLKEYEETLHKAATLLGAAAWPG